MSNDLESYVENYTSLKAEDLDHISPSELVDLFQERAGLLSALVAGDLLHDQNFVNDFLANVDVIRALSIDIFLMQSFCLNSQIGSERLSLSGNTVSQLTVFQTLARIWVEMPEAARLIVAMDGSLDDVEKKGAVLISPSDLDGFFPC